MVFNTSYIKRTRIWGWTKRKYNINEEEAMKEIFDWHGFFLWVGVMRRDFGFLKIISSKPIIAAIKETRQTSDWDSEETEYKRKKVNLWNASTFSLQDKIRFIWMEVLMMLLLLFVQNSIFRVIVFWGSRGLLLLFPPLNWSMTHGKLK